MKAWLPALLLLLTLAAAIEGPILSAGWRNAGLAEKEAAEGQYGRASQSYELAARQLPWQPGLWEEAGLTAFQAHEPGEAIRLLRIASGRGPLSSDGAVALGSALWTEGQSSAAIAAWQAGSKTYPANADLLDRLIAAYDQQRAYADERATLTTRLSLGPDPASSYRLGVLMMVVDPGGAEAQLDAAASADPRFEPAVTTLRAALQAARRESDVAGRLVVIGRSLGLVEEWGPALEAFDQAVKTNQTDADAWAWLGEAQQHLDQDGLGALDRALALDPGNAVVHGLRALYFARHGNEAAALAEQLQAAQLQPQNSALQAALGAAYASAGNLVAALAAYQKATSLAPDDAATWSQLAAFCVDNGVQVQTIGLPAAMKAVSLAPHDGLALDVLGWSYAQIGLPQTAKDTLLQAIQAQPELVQAHVHLAAVYLRMGDSIAARAELEQATALDPSSSAGQLAAQMLRQYFP